MVPELKIIETRAWMVKAYQDIQSAKWLLASPDGLYHAVGFHSQQAAEKALKAFLTWHEEPFEKTHSLVALVAKCVKFDESLQNLRQAATTLTPYAVAFRYPGDLPELTAEEANEAYQLALQVWGMVQGKLPGEAGP
jgi:HEPN domain-containing protein